MNRPAYIPSHWKPVSVDTPVLIPTEDGKSVARSVNVTVDAWEDSAGDVYFDGHALRKLDEVKAKHMGLSEVPCRARRKSESR
jgi:hypothetical protein